MDSPPLTERRAAGTSPRAAASVPPLLSLRDVSRVYGQGDARVRALDHVDLDVLPGEFVAITGASGSGKSTMLSVLGLLDLPSDGAYRIEGIAHQSEPLIRTTERYDEMDQALADASFVVGTTARPRTAQRNFAYPRDAAREIIERAAQETVVVMFGREDKGLPNEALDRCHRVVVIPTDPGYSSLNLAQACLVMCYEIFLATGEAAPHPKGRRIRTPASHQDHE